MIFSDECVMVSPDGIDEPQCLNYSIYTPCRTLSYPINQGFSSICLHGKFYNISDDARISYCSDKATIIKIFCKECQLMNSEITLSCQVNAVSQIYFADVLMKNSIVRLYNINIIFSNVTLEQSFIQDFSYFSEKGNNQIQFEDSTLSCLEPGNCGLSFTNINAVKIIIVRSHLHSFRLELSTSQLIFICHETYMTMTSMNIKVRSFEYLRIPAIIDFHKVRVHVLGKKVVKDMPKKSKTKCGIYAKV